MTVRTLAEDLARAAARDPEAEALVAGDQTLSYADLHDRAAGFAAGLRDLGVGRGDRVALLLPNGIDAVVGIKGTMRAGAALAPLNPTIKADRLRYVLADLEASAVVTNADHAELAGLAAPGGTQVVPAVGELDGAVEALPPPPLGTDLAAVMYTSGSTGEPKGVTLTHANLAFVTDSIVEYLGMRSDDRILCVLQLSFGYGLSQLLTSARAGATLVVEPGMGLAGKLVRALEDNRITGMACVPTIFQVLISLKGLAERELPDLRFLTNAGASLPAATVRAVRETFPNARLFLMYGLTECVRVSYLPPEEVDARPTSSGVAIPGTEAWVERPEAGVADVGEVGELMVRGPHVMQGYWRDPKRTAERLRPGRWPWEPVLATGDLFRRDEDGFLHWVGRTDDLIKCRGEKVYPREVEEVLQAAAAVREAAVVGVPDPLLGQAVHAHVALLDAADADERDLRRLCAESLEDHKVPQRIILHDELPRTSRGKVDRAALVAASAGEEAGG